MTRVYNGGTYDLLHTGHLFVLRQCRDLAGPDGEVVIGLNGDDFVARFKGHPTVQPYLERAEILAALRLVDRVVPNVDAEDARTTVEAVMPDVIAVGRDWWSEDDSKYLRQMGMTRDWLEERGIRLHYLRWLPGRSSTNIRTTAGGIVR